MKITIQDIAPGEEEEIIVRCRDLDEALLRMIHELKTRRGKFTVTDNDKIRQIDAGDIVDRQISIRQISRFPSNKYILRIS